jgi:flagellar hook-length control protein FliK
MHAPKIIEQLVSQIHVAKLGQEGGRATLRLNPDSLGQVEVRLEMEGGHLRAHFSAQNADVREALRQHMPELQRALAENKVSLSSLQVEVGRGSEGRQESSLGGKQARMKRASHGPVPAASTGPAPRKESGLDLYA